MAAKQLEIPKQYSAGWLDSLDGRYGLARELRQRFTEICSDLGGEAELSYMQRSLIERALWLEYWLTRQERELMQDAKFDVSRWIQAANSLQGIYSRLGLQRQARDTPDLQTYLKQREAQS